MMTFNQILLATKIEYHWWRIGALRKKKANVSERRKQNMSASENLHRYRAEKALIEYEITLGLRNYNGLFLPTASHKCSGVLYFTQIH
jgi:hypothetical protein